MLYLYCVVNSTTAIATDRPTADAVAAVDSTPILLKAAAKTMMIGVAVSRPSCASLMVARRFLELKICFARSVDGQS